MSDSKVSPNEFQEEPDYFGACLVCSCNDGYLNVGSSHWFHCREHKTRWCVGVNLFSGWREEDEEDWRKNAEKLFGYTEVEPLMPSWCRPISKEEVLRWPREQGWIEESPGVWRNPLYDDGLF